jgi:hypothetical protein
MQFARQADKKTIVRKKQERNSCGRGVKTFFVEHNSFSQLLLMVHLIIFWRGD